MLLLLPCTVLAAEFVVLGGAPSEATALTQVLTEASLVAEELGFQAPDRVVEVFIADGKPNSPSSFGHRAYTDTDDSGAAFLVVSSSVAENATANRGVLAHEWGHILQLESGRFSAEAGHPDLWFFEATSEWLSATIYPNSLDAAGFWFAYLENPALPVNHFSPPDGTSVGYFAYGASIYLHSISQQLGPEVITATWSSAGPATPLKALHEQVQLAGSSADEMFVQHVLWVATEQVGEADWWSRAKEQLPSRPKEFLTKDGGSLFIDSPVPFSYRFLPLIDPDPGPWELNVQVLPGHRMFVVQGDSVEEVSQTWSTDHQQQALFVLIGLTNAQAGKVKLTWSAKIPDLVVAPPKPKPKGCNSAPRNSQVSLLLASLMCLKRRRLLAGSFSH